MFNETIFIASSTASIEVAKLIKDHVVSLGYINTTIWNEGVFGLTESIFERLLTAAADFDFAIMIWAADDVMASKGMLTASPRDNVVFEGGLFIGAIGRNRVFIVCDKSSEIKIPSDFSGVTLAYYDGSRIESDKLSAVADVCEKIAIEIRKPRFEEYSGLWRSRYPETADKHHREVIDHVEITASRGGLFIEGKKTKDGHAYSAFGRVHDKQVMGNWEPVPDRTIPIALLVFVAGQ